MSKKALAITFLVLILASFSAAEDLDIQVQGPDINQFDMGINSSNVVATELFADLSGDEDFYVRPDDVVNSSQLDDTGESPYIIAEYQAKNESSGNTYTKNKSLEYNDKLETWNLEFVPNTTEIDEIEFRANVTIESRETDSQFPFDRDEIVPASVSDVRTELLPETLLSEDLEEVDFSLPLKPDMGFERLEAEVFNESSETYLDIEDDEVQVDVYFNDASNIYQKTELQEYVSDEDVHRTSESQVPDISNSSLIMRLTSTNSAGNVISSEAHLVETAEILEGEFNSLESTGCTEESGNLFCEPEAEVTTEYDITSSEAEQMNLTLEAWNTTAEEYQNVTEPMEMTEIAVNDGVQETYETTFEIPDLNTTEYETGFNNLNFNFEAFNNLREHQTNQELTFLSFEIVDDTKSTITAGQEHEIQIVPRKPISNTIYSDIERFQSIDIEITSDESDFNQSFTRSDLGFDPALSAYSTGFVIPEDEVKDEILENSNESEPFTIETEIEDLFGEEKQNQKGISVVGPETTFAVEDEIDLEYESENLYNETVDAENLQNESLTLEASSDSDTVIVDDTYTLEPGEETGLDFQVNLTDFEDETVDITFEDEAGRIQTTQVSIETVNCIYESGQICSQEDEISISSTSEDSFNQTVSLTNFGEEELDVDFSVEGNASDVTSIESNTTLEPGTQTQNMEVIPEDGSYEGNLTVSSDDDSIDIPISGVIDIEEEEVDTGLSVDPQNLDLGMYPEDHLEEFEREVTLENTGEALIEDIEASGMDVEVESFSLDEGEEQDVTLELGNVQESDSVLFEGESEGEDVSANVNVLIDIIDNYSERTGEILDQVQDLRSQTDDATLESDLTEVETMISDIDSHWDSGEYEQAQETFNDAQDELASIETSISATDTDQQTQEDEGSDLPIIPIVGTLVILLLIGGLVFYESYIPEEGDPLYGVLGE